MLCDLHIHSVNSSGSQTIEEICQQVVSKNIKLISITDDDTTVSYFELAKLVPKYRINYIQGVEVSASLSGQLFRFLAYDFDIVNKGFQELLSFNQSVWHDLGKLVVEVYTKHFLKASVEGYSNFKPSPGLGGFKHNKYMSSLGYDESFNADLKFFMQHPKETEKIKAAYSNFKDVSEVIPILHQAGGMVFVSAEYFRDQVTFEGMVDKAMDLGIDGFECYRNLDKGLENAMVEYAKSHNMLITGGGNGHGNWTDPNRYSIGISNVQSNHLNLGEMKVY